MYANKRTVEKAQNLNAKHRQDARRNRIIHRGMQKSHVQVLPDGKTIQHYKMDSRSAQVMRGFKKAQKKAAETSHDSVSPSEDVVGDAE